MAGNNTIKSKFTHLFLFLTHRGVTLIPEEAEDMWHAYNLVTVGDTLRSTTIRYNGVQYYLKTLAFCLLQLCSYIILDQSEFDMIIIC